MICPTCHGDTTVPIKDDAGRIVGVRYCPECGGWGIASCCDAAGSAQPEPEDKDE